MLLRFILVVANVSIKNWHGYVRIYCMYILCYLNLLIFINCSHLSLFFFIQITHLSSQGRRNYYKKKRFFYFTVTTN